VVRDLFVAAQLLSVAATATGLALWYDLLRRRADARVALAALLVLASNAYVFRYGYAATTDALAIALQIASLWMLLTGERPRAAFAAGALAALAFLTRYSAIALLPAGLVAAFAGGTQIGRRRAATALFALGFFAPVVPWVLYSLAHGGRFSFQLHHNIAYEVFAHARGITWDEYQQKLQPQFHSLWDVIARDPRAVASRMLANLVGHARDSAKTLTGWPVAIAALAGIALGARDGTLRRLWPVWLAGGLTYLSLVPAFYSERYALAVMPAIAALAGVAFGSPRLALAVRPARGVWLKAAVCLVVIGFAAGASVAFQRYTIEQLPYEVLEAGRTLARLARPGDRVIARKAHIAYYGRVEASPAPFAATLEAFGASARAAGARWLYFSWPEAETRPVFFHLLDTTGVVPGLTPRFAHPVRPAVLYEIGPDFGRAPAWYANDTLRAYHTLRGRLAVDGRDWKARYDLARIERMIGRLDDARVSARLASIARPDRPEPPVLEGWLAMQAGDHAGAESAFRRALVIEPRSTDARLGFGWARAMEGDVNGAAEAWRPVVESASDPATLARMAQTFDAVHDEDSAARARRRLAGLGGAR
jgi:4-amino-4-deoxy-L-arabinose transferase-like glycosyltransferase